MMVASLVVAMAAGWEYAGWEYPVPEIMSREDWGAQPMVQKLEKHKITMITVHHTGVKAAPERDFGDKLRGLQAWSQRDDELAGGKKKPQWADIPYHYYIDVHGKIAECRPVEYPGDTNTNYDTTGHALVVVEGLFPEDHFSYAQRKALRNVVTWLSFRFNVPASKVQGHSDVAPGQTTCPGESIVEELPHLREWVREYREKAGLDGTAELTASLDH